jgi:Na+-driven multidrug efflux pump
MSRPKSKEMDLTVGNPFWSLLKFAIPVILGNLFQLFYTLADSVIVGKTLGADSLAAVGATSIIIYFVFCFINGFTGGFGICLGQRCGAKDEKGMRKSVAVSTLLSIIFTIVLTAGSPDSQVDADSGGYFRRSLRLHVCRSSRNGRNCFL